MTRRTKSVDFEHALRELESLVEKLEHGELPLEESLRHFERGVALTRECQTALKAAEARVEILTRRRDASNSGPQEAAGEALEPFEADGDEADPA